MAAIDSTSNRASPKASGKVLAMHQPNYLPWLGYFYKMAHCDVFVYLDAVQYPRGQSFAARNRVKTPNGVAFLTIPIRHPKGREGKFTYLEVELADDKWKAKHLKTVELSYKRAPYFEEVYPLYREQLLAHDRFVELTLGLIETFANYLNIRSQRVRLSQLLSQFGQKSQLIVDLCRAMGATVYLSGTGGGKDYNDEEFLKAHGIQLIYSDFHHPTYPQLWGEFEPRLSILDVLFNCGPETGRFLSLAG